MTENELRQAAAAAQQREQERQAQYLLDQQRRREQQLQAQRDQRIVALRSALHATFGAGLERDLGGSYTVVGDLSLMDVVYEMSVAEVVMRIRQVQDDDKEQWVCEAVTSGTRVPVKAVPDRVEVNRDRLLLALHAVYDRCDMSTNLAQRAVGNDW